MSRAGARIGLLFVIALSACGGDDAGGPASARRVTIDLRSLLTPFPGSTQQDCVSAIAEAVLRAGPPNGAARELRSPIPAGASSVSFENVQVDQGPVSFSVRITSDNGTVVYGKDTTAQIDEATFSIAVVVDKLAAVLQVCPGHVTLDRPHLFQQTLEVRNRGIGTLEYQAESPDCQGGPCLAFTPPTGTVVEGIPDTFVDSLTRVAPVASVEMRVRSPVGSVPIIVTLPQLPDLVVAAFDRTGDPIPTPAGFEVPVSVTIRNDGNVPAGIFLVEALYGPGIAAQFTPNSTTAPIAPGASERIVGTVFFGPGLEGQSIQLHMLADTCSSDGPDPCEVDEFSETNNSSPSITVQFPIL